VTKKIGGEGAARADRLQFFPDGRHFLYSVAGDSAETSGIYVASLEDDAPAKRLLPNINVAKYVPSAVPGRSGHVLFVRDGTLMARPVDANTFTVTGQNFPVAESVGRFSVSQNGALAYMAGFPAARRELLWVDRSGRPLRVAAPAAEYNSVRLSPDETSIAFTRVGEAGRDDVWVLDLVRGVPTRITSDPAMDYLAEWSHDGRRILWASRRSGTYDLYTKAASGTGQEERLITMGTVQAWATDWSPDGKFVLYQRSGAKTSSDLWIAPQSAGASGEPQTPFPYLDSPSTENDGVFSPDGHWIAYESNESGRPEIYVQSFPLPNQKVQISTGGGTDAAWSKNGRELFYLAAADRNLMAVPYRATATTFEPDVGKALFPLPGNVERRSYAVTGDGRRFLIGKPVESISEPITMVLNWLDERKLNAQKQPGPSK
jgi:Tol biopolymer transport system component